MDEPKFIKALTQKELYVAYGITRKTFMVWIKPFEPIIGEYVGKCYTPAQVKKIFELLGEPGK